MRKYILNALFATFLIALGFTTKAQTYNMSNGTYNTCSGNFYDAGGSAAAYNNNELYVETFCANNGGNMKATFTSFQIENYYDSLYIFDGPNVNSNLIGTYTGTTGPGVVTSTGSCLTFKFKSDVSVVYSGFAATLICTAPVVPVVDFTPSATTGCTPLNVNFTNTSTGCANFYWDLGTGASSYNTNVSETYNGGGQTYTVTLYAYDYNWNSLGTKSITITTNNVANYLNVSSPSCPNTPVYFAYNDYTPTYNWTFGDGQTSTLSNPNHTYTAIGSYTATLTVDGLCPQTITQVVDINNNVPGVASFGSYFPSGSSCPGSPVSFYPYQNSTTYNWNFGDGNTSNIAGPQHAYATAGNYNVTLTTTNACGNSATETKTVNINNTSTFPAALSINSMSTICPGGNAQFGTDYGYGQYVWNFGDGTPSVTQDQYGSYTNHTYLSAGNYTVSVDVTDFCGNDTIVSIVYTIGTTAPVTNANVNGTVQACPNSNAYFNAAYGYDHYTWNFGDGTPVINSGNYVNHAFSQAGNDTVRVTIYNSCGGDTTVYTVVNIVNNLPLTGGSLSASPFTVCPNEGVNFNGNPYDASTYVWNFGDGSDSLVTSLNYGVNHSYASAGVYTATLHVTNACGADSIVYTTINVTNNNPVSNANLNTPKLTYCLNEPVYIYAYAGGGAGASGGSSNIFVYNYGDGSAQDSLLNGNSQISHSYGTVGTYTISAHIYNSCGNDTIVTRTITVSNTNTVINQPYFNESPNTVCPGGSVHFDTSNEFLTYTWNFGDGTTSQGTSYANHTYSTLGNYTPTLMVTNYCGADSTFTLPPVLVSSLSPVSNNIYISANPYSACPNDDVAFSVSSGYASYIWNFGDGQIDTTSSSNTTHAYTSVAVYNVSCLVINQCGNSRTIYSTINISNTSSLPDLKIETRASSFCINDNVDFDINLLYSNGGNNHYSSSYDYSWNFGDGQTALTNGTGTTHQYAANGTYTVTVVITNGCGVSTTLSKIVVINSSSAPQTNFFGPGGETALFCPNDVVLFAYSGTSNNNVITFGDGNSATMTETIINEEGHLMYIIKHAYNNNGQYWVYLNSTNGCGLTSRDSVSITVGNNNLPVQGGVYISSSSTGVLTTCSPVTMVGIGGASYAWNFGDGQTSSSTSPVVSHIYSTAGSYLVSCVITNGCGNTATFTETVLITGGVGITASFSSTATPTCYGGANGSTTVSVVGGQSPYTYSWSNGQTTSTATGLSAGSYTVTVTDATGCAGNNTVTISAAASMTINVASTTSACATPTGTATVSSVTGVAGPYTYLWSTGATTSNISAIGAGTYTVAVTAANGCTQSTSLNVSATGAPTISTNTVTNITCYGGSSGAINVNVTGGTAPYTYHWSNDSTTQDLTGLHAGTYTLTVTDAGSCASVYSNTVNQGTAVNVSVTVTQQADCGQFNGIAVASATGGTGPYNYAWATLGNNATQGSLPAGTYDVTVTDAVGCAGTQQVTVNNANAPIVVGTVANVTCNGLGNGSVILNTTGGTSPYSYTWLNNGLHSYTQTNMAPGIYTVKVVDHTACEVYTQFTITQPQVLGATATATSSNCGHNNGTVTSTVSGGNTPYTYNWSNSQHTSTISNLAAATYTLNIIDNKGCTTSANATVAVSAPAQSICVVSVDQAVNKNVVVWEKTTGQGVSAYNIYKESNVAGIYNILAQVPAGDVSEFTDTASHPDQRSYRYKIQTVDSCANNGAISAAHKTIHLNVNLGVPQTNVNLIWEVYEGFNYGTYNIWRGTGLGSIAQIDQVPSSILSYTDVNAPVGADSLYYFIEMVSPDAGGCTSAFRVEAGRNFNSGKSNTSGLRYSNPTALVNTTAASTLYLYPNPNNGQFKIDLSISEKQQIDLLVYDLRGRIVKSENFGSIDKGRYVKQVDLSEMAKGVYMIQINTKQGVINNKVIIE